MIDPNNAAAYIAAFKHELSVARISMRLSELDVQIPAEDRAAFPNALVLYGAASMIRDGSSATDAAAVLRRMADEMDGAAA